MDLFTKSESTDSADKQMCQRASYSKAFEQWTNAYCNGDEKEANQKWKEVLSQLTKCGDIGPLIDLACARTAFRDVKMREQGNAILPAEITELTNATAAAVGPKHRFMASMYRFSARYLEGGHKYKNAIEYRQKQMDILKANSPTDYSQECSCLTLLGNDGRLMGNHELAESSYKAALKVGTDHNLAFESTTALAAYVNYLNNLGRNKEAFEANRLYGPKIKSITRLPKK
jgi:tetratricopeptide (TPR) repeat protein